MLLRKQQWQAPAMLDLTKLALQMQGISQHLLREAAASQTRLNRAKEVLRQAIPRQTELVKLHQDWQQRMTFTAATPVEALNTRVAIAPPPPAHSILATDGSQISPSHHEIAYCYLINIGRIAIHYGLHNGQQRQPLLDSLPEIYYQAQDLYAARQWGISTEEWMGHRRTVSEIEMLAELGTALVEQRGQAATAKELAIASSAPQSAIASSASAPSLAMVDGSLIYWFLDSLPADARALILPDILAAWQQLQASGIPFVGYLSASRSTESLNFLRLQACPYLAPDCQTHCAEDRDKSPCQVFTPLRDVTLWSTTLEPGERGPLWRSSARILEEYGEENSIYFCYVNVGVETARVEFPAWVAADSAMLDSALSLVMAQVQKGYGYPIALAEAHNHAVVRGGDRKRFFLMLERQMLKAGLPNIGTSYKEARKRGSIA